MPNNIIRQDFGSLGNDVQTQMLIAPVLAEMIATQPFAINDQFIVDNVLYKATKAIGIGDTISVGTSTTDNCVLSDSITQQIGMVDFKIPSTNADIQSLLLNNDSYTTTKPSLVFGYIAVAGTSSTYASISSEGGGGFLFYPAPGTLGCGIRIVPAGTTITLVLASGAKANVHILPLEDIFANFK